MLGLAPMDQLRGPLSQDVRCARLQRVYGSRVCKVAARYTHLYHGLRGYQARQRVDAVRLREWPRRIRGEAQRLRPQGQGRRPDQPTGCVAFYMVPQE